MYCGNCGHQMKDGERFCTNCGFDNKPKDEKKEEAKEEKVVEVKPGDETKPVVAPTVQNVPAQEPTPIVGIFALIGSLIFWPVGLVLGIIAIVKGKEEKTNKILGIIATVISTISLIITIIVLVFVLSVASTVQDTYDNYDYDYTHKYDDEDDIEEELKGKWVCTISGSTESMIITFKDDDKFSASHDTDSIEGNYYAYEDFKDENKANIYMYYYDDDNYESTQAEFTKITSTKSNLKIEDQIFNCTR